MNVYYPKATPKVHDYNPITHSGFYSTPDTSLNKSYNPPKSSKPFSNIFSAETSTSNYKDPITGRFYRYKDDRKTLSQTGSIRLNNSQPIDIDKYASIINPSRLYKSKPKEFSPNPINGILRNFESPKPSYMPLQSKPESSPPAFDFLQKNSSDLRDTIAASLKKPVPNVAYVNPYMLKASSNSPLKSDISFKKAAEAFY